MNPLDCLQILLYLLFMNTFSVFSEKSTFCSNVVHYSSYKFEEVAILDVPLNDGNNSVKLNVRMVARGTLPTRYVGLIELVETQEFSNVGIEDNESKKVKFRIRFPTNRPLPFIKSISVNDEKLCDGNVNIFSYYGPVVTQISLQYVLQLPLLPQDDPSSTLSSSYTETNGEHHKFSIIKDCGLVDTGSKVPVKKSDWPWLVAVFVQTASSKIFLCSGTLLTAKHIIMTAHCVSNHHKEDELIVKFGNFLKKSDTGIEFSHERKVSKLHINPFSEDDPFHSNAVILELSEPIHFRRNVKPACLWRQIPNLPPILEAVGTVALWIVDLDGSLLPNNPSFIQVRIKSPDVCGLDDDLSQPYTLCTVAVSDLNWCPGAYGGELLIRKGESSGSNWRLRGVIQFRLDFENCTSSKQLLFTDIGMYSDWLGQILWRSLN